ncbi:hypothetical protein F5Y19DRAFT_427430 [Xylariaceae sp. FL1651]|nr:hypothetical protein F5Y19DRAFT_427430 [Xylariaceae sp. FL1651]
MHAKRVSVRIWSITGVVVAGVTSKLHFWPFGTGNWPFSLRLPCRGRKGFWATDSHISTEATYEFLRTDVGQLS